MSEKHSTQPYWTEQAVLPLHVVQNGSLFIRETLLAQELIKRLANPIAQLVFSVHFPEGLLFSHRDPFETGNSNKLRI